MTDVWEIFGSGIIAALGLLGSSLLLKWIYKPKIVVEKKSMELLRIPVFFLDEEIDSKRYVKSTPYSLHRIKIKNNGKTSAKNCNVTLDLGYREIRLIWKSSQKENIIINSKSYEYVDVCAIHLDDREKTFNHFKTIYSEIDLHKSELLGSLNPEYVQNTFNELINLENRLKSEYPQKNRIPDILLPSENGWTELLKDIRFRYLEGYFHYDSKCGKIIITSANAKPIEFKIKINYNQDKNGSYIIFED